MSNILRVVFVFGLLFSTAAKAETITVCSSCNITSIVKAISIAKEFDTILVKKGTYKEHSIIIDKPLTIIGENYPIIDGELKGEIITIVSDNVTVDGLFIINVGISFTQDYAAIRVRKSEHFEIKKCRSRKAVFWHLYRKIQIW